MIYLLMRLTPPRACTPWRSRASSSTARVSPILACAQVVLRSMLAQSGLAITYAQCRGFLYVGYTRAVVLLAEDPVSAVRPEPPANDGGARKQAARKQAARLVLGGCSCLHACASPQRGLLLVQQATDDAQRSSQRISIRAVGVALGEHLLWTLRSFGSKNLAPRTAALVVLLHEVLCGPGDLWYGQ
ncbi:hypothetical protein HYPSUDRAFT_638106 [Hypholoma sublateritium FD-334 SS-4]|uniref:Uncharacterized protein n=1 Tax=Hypholoma sublateritium (strain FD-334 SS-4) TaxID=945553 RepID=A0A0D2MGL7_HYPSF|nr:hypothetical protein HYPSUDRAFT_638106 [Hypholoma sublateritium FD-334 SS-4]